MTKSQSKDRAGSVGGNKIGPGIVSIVRQKPHRVGKSRPLIVRRPVKKAVKVGQKYHS